MTYRPASVPSAAPPPLAQYLAQEFQRISTALDQAGTGTTDPPATGLEGLLAFGGLWSNETTEPGNISGSLIRQQDFGDAMLTNPIGITQDVANDRLIVSTGGVYWVYFWGKLFCSLTAVLDRIIEVSIYVNGVDPNSVRRHSGSIPLNSTQCFAMFGFLIDLNDGDILTVHWGGGFTSGTISNVQFENAEFTLFRLDP